jgi:hypothetical protein
VTHFRVFRPVRSVEPDSRLLDRDRKNGYGGFWATQILPLADPASFGGDMEFKAAFYDPLRSKRT